MGYQIIWSDRSLTHLQSALGFISSENPLAAGKLGEKILHRVGLLEDFPRFGRIYAPLQRDDVRETPVPPYRIIYHVADQSRIVTILAVWHGAREEPDLALP